MRLVRDSPIAAYYVKLDRTVVKSHKCFFECSNRFRAYSPRVASRWELHVVFRCPKSLRSSFQPKRWVVVGVATPRKRFAVRNAAGSKLPALELALRDRVPSEKHYRDGNTAASTRYRRLRTAVNGEPISAFFAWRKRRREFVELRNLAQRTAFLIHDPVAIVVYSVALVPGRGLGLD